MYQHSGFCQCGCGQRTPIAKKTRNLLGHVKGQPIPYVNGHNRKKSERYSVVDRGYDSPCHVWLLAINQHGYGVESIGHTQRMAHVIAWERAYGEILDGLQLDHLCRQRDCCNVDHLEPVSPATNVQRGEKSRLTAEEVRAIRRMLSQGYKHLEIAQIFNVCRATVSQIARGKTWTNVH